MANTQSLFGPVAVGKDTSGNFKQSLAWGLAVRLTSDGPYYAKLSDGPGPVPDEALIIGTESMIFRLPVSAKPPKADKGIREGDIVILSDNPLRVLLVEAANQSTGAISGYVLSPTAPPPVPKQEIPPPANLMNQPFWVIAAGPERLLDDKDSGELLPLLLAGGQSSPNSSGAATSDPLTTFLMLQSMGKKKLSETGLALLFLSQNSGASGSNLLPLLLALRGGELLKTESK